MTTAFRTLLSQRVQLMDESATLAMARRAAEMRAKGIDVIGLSAGEPDFDTPEHIKAAAAEAMRQGKTKYTPASGIPELKQAVAKKFERENSLAYDPSQILVSCGAKHAVYNVIHALIDEGDEVLIPAPYWTSYPDIVKSAGGRPVILPTEESDGFRLRPGLLENAVNSKTKALLYSSPSNPTGCVYDETDLRAVASALEEMDLVVISDEVYEHFVYGGARSVSFAQLGPDAFERTVVVNSVSKSYAMTGWRIGYAAGPKEIIDAAAKIQSQSTSNATSIAQYAAVAALEGDQSCIPAMAQEYAKRRDLVLARLRAIPGISCVEPQGAFYAFPNVSSLYGKAHRGHPIRDSVALAERLLEEARIALVAGSAFGSPDHIRISYATSMENLAESMNRLDRFVRELL